MNARRHMLHAAYFAGNAFSKSYVGYVHAVAHSLGGRYNTPHGLANAVLLPYVLQAYGRHAYRKLHRLAVAIGISDPVKAIESVRKNHSGLYGTYRICWISPENCRKYEQRIFLPLPKKRIMKPIPCTLFPNS